MFLGEFKHTLDVKGRVSLPARFREEMTGRLVVSKSFENCLRIYPVDRYESLLERLQAGNDFDPRQRSVRRFFTAGAVDVQIDGAGRVKIPASLQEFAGLTKDVVINGNIDHIEVWDAEAWAAYDAETTEHIEENAAHLAGGGVL